MLCIHTLWFKLKLINRVSIVSNRQICLRIKPLLNVPNFITGVEMCLTLAHFAFKHSPHRQTDDFPMSPSVPLIVANLPSQFSKARPWIVASDLSRTTFRDNNDMSVTATQNGIMVPLPSFSIDYVQMKASDLEKVISSPRAG